MKNTGWCQWEADERMANMASMDRSCAFHRHYEFRQELVLQSRLHCEKIEYGEYIGHCLSGCNFFVHSETFCYQAKSMGQ